MDLRIASIVVLVAATACGGVQTATVGPVTIPIAPDRAPEGTKRFVARSGHSHITVYGGDVLNGHQVTRIDRSRVVLATEPALAVFVEAEMDSLHNTDHNVESFLKDDLLEVAKFPRATLRLTLVPKGDTSEHRATGTLSLHGVQRAIELAVTLLKEGDAVRVRASFYISRKDFDISRHDIGDGAIDDGVMVHIDAVATPERVVVEELDQ